MELILGALILVIGVIIGRFAAPRRLMAPRLPPPPKPICGCGHHLSYHDRKTGQCNNYQPGVENMKTKALVQCKCRQYSGPLPLEQLVPTEISD